MNEDDIVEYFEYLEALRESGETNMFGAGPYLMEVFGVSRKESHEILERWMGSYDKEEEE